MVPDNVLRQATDSISDGQYPVTVGMPRARWEYNWKKQGSSVSSFLSSGTLCLRDGGVVALGGDSEEPWKFASGVRLVYYCSMILNLFEFG